MHTVAPAADPVPVEHELKLTLPALRANALLAWLRGRCRPDPRYPRGHVTSVYFDNRRLSLLRAKINSDFIKEKVRVRWYADADTRTPRGDAFVELKRKIGSRRFKTRVPLGTDAAALLLAGEGHGGVDRVLESLRRAGQQIPSDLRPFLRISFRRHRFVDPTSGSRISLDSEICGRSVGRGLLPVAHTGGLAHAVVEVKGPRSSIPATLAPLLSLGCRRESFSKYARCYLKLTRRSSF